MSYLSGLLVIDAPASALNNAGADSEARTENAVAVKFIRAPEGRYPYVSAQAVRYWLRTTLAQEKGWSASPVFRESKVAYTDAEPSLYAEDDLFGYMRAGSKSNDEKKAAKRAEIAAASTPVDAKTGEVTRISPFRVGTLVSIAPVRITGDFGTMVRAEGDPVPHEHQFYRAQLKAPFGIDLTSAGTFFHSERVGYKNIDSNRKDNALKAGAKECSVRGFPAYRLPDEKRAGRVSQLVRAIGQLQGGAKQTLHLTDTAPSFLVMAVCKSGHHPFVRLLTEGPLGTVVFREDVLEEVLRVYKNEIESDIYIGWAKGFLDSERTKLEAFMKDSSKTQGLTLHLGHPREIAELLASELRASNHHPWFA